jgi:uncharacterized membrane protein YecN with MAPEG domain
MIFPTITGFYTAVFSLLLVGLSAYVIRTRRHHKVPIGHGDIEQVERAMRAHGNFTDYIPFALLLLLLAEMYGTSTLLLHLMGGALLIGRITHVFSLLHLESKSQKYGLRVFGMSLTFAVLVVGSLSVFWQLWHFPGGFPGAM